MSILIIGEKPNVGRAISSVIGANNTQKGYTEGNGYIVSWCVGHLVGLKFPNDYGNGWDQKWSFSQLPMIPEKWQFRVTDSTKAQYELLKNLMNRVDVSEIICATDADREGECIFRYVYNMARCRKPVKRLWVSSLEEKAIRQALTTMKPMSAYDNLFNAGYARARADWLVGMNGSRLFSIRYGGKLNIGRVQTPTLAMIVQRDAEVNSFVKQKYYTADLNCGEFILSSARNDDENAGEAKDNAKVIDAIMTDLAAITGQKPIVCRAKKSVANFKLREGMPIGVKVTLRSEKMYEFVDKLFNVAFPRVRDFRGINGNSFDGKGNYSTGIKEQLIFPEIEYDKIDKVRGMDINFITTANTDEEAKELLSLLGAPFIK